jgi:thiamine-phosphate pyrophosphorylase
MASEDTRIPDTFGLYVILTNPVRGYEYCADVCVEFAVPFVQLRIKETSEYQVLRIAEKLRYITHHSATRLIINDYPDVARDCSADGVHVGQDDMPFEEVKEIVGPEMLIGLSTHNPEQTEEACKKRPDYIGIGPVYATPTKKIPDPVLGIDGMKEMLAKATVPAVCIGGITLERLPEVLKAGARNFCMVRPVCESREPGKVIKKIIETYLLYSNDFNK